MVEGPGVSGASETSVNSLVLLLRFHEIAIDPAQIRHQFGKDSFGVTEILLCAKELKLKARTLLTDWSWLSKTPFPALAECRDGSFVVLGRVLEDKVLIQDPRMGRP